MNRKLQIKRLLASGVKVSNKIFHSLRKTQAQAKMGGLRASRLARYNSSVIAKDFKTLKLIAKQIDKLALMNIKTPKDVINASNSLENLLKLNGELKTRISVLAKLIKASELPIEADDEFEDIAPVDEIEADDEFEDEVSNVEADDEFEDEVSNVEADDEFEDIAPVDEIEADDEFEDIAPVDEIEADDEFEDDVSNELQSRANRVKSRNMKRARSLSAKRSTMNASARNSYGIKWNFGLSGR